MLDSFYHMTYFYYMTIKITWKSHFWYEKLSFSLYVCNIVMNCIYIALKNIYTISGLWSLIHRGSYMSACVLLNLLNELGERYKM